MDGQTRGMHFANRTHKACVCYNSFQTFLASDELGDSLNGVEVLIKKHEDFEKTLAAWEEKFKASETHNRK